jgi:hypothetical protein
LTNIANSSENSDTPNESISTNTKQERKRGSEYKIIERKTEGIIRNENNQIKGKMDRRIEDYV